MSWKSTNISLSVVWNFERKILWKTLFHRKKIKFKKSFVGTFSASGKDRNSQSSHPLGDKIETGGIMPGVDKWGKRCMKDLLEKFMAVKSMTKTEASWCFTLSHCPMKLMASKFKTNKRLLPSLWVEPASVICYCLESDLAVRLVKGLGDFMTSIDIMCQLSNLWIKASAVGCWKLWRGPEKAPSVHTLFLRSPLSTTPSRARDRS